MDQAVTRPHVVIVIVTRNHWAETAACLDSLAAVDYPNFQTVVVDNGSTDETVTAVRRQYPDISVVDTGANLGYADGNNTGMRWALRRGAEYVLLLNNDTIVAPDFLTCLIDAAEADPDAGLLGPMVYHHSEPNLIQSAGGERTPDWQFYHRGQNEPDTGRFREVEPVTWLTGCAILARREYVENDGFLDPDFFLYSEDVDWCVRAEEAGFRVLFVPQSRIWHKGVKPDYNPGPYVTYYSARNHLLLLTKHHAGTVALARNSFRQLRTLTSWSVRPRWRDQRLHRDALARALYDFALGRFGPVTR